MKLTLLAGVGLLAVAAQSVAAADIPVSMPVKAPVVAPMLDWMGFYAGVHVGYGWGDVDTNYTPLPSAILFGALAPTTLSADLSGVFGGVQIGYNWQYAPSWILGWEADISRSGIDGSARGSPILSVSGVPVPGSELTTSQDVDWFGTVRARLGFLSTPNLLIYGTGGFAYGRVNYNANTAYTAVQYPSSHSKWKGGWTAGGGLEWAFPNNWSAKFEYLYVDLGKESVVADRIPAAPPFQVGHMWETKFHTVRFGLNAHW